MSCAPGALWTSSHPRDGRPGKASRASIGIGSAALVSLISTTPPLLERLRTIRDTTNRTRLLQGSRLPAAPAKAPLEYSRGPEKTWVYGGLRVADGHAVTMCASSRNSAFYQDFLRLEKQANPLVLYYDY
jgi:hypothetical protein